MSGVKQKSGGPRKGAGRKTAEELGIEKKKMYPAYLTPSQYKKAIAKYSSLTNLIETVMNNYVKPKKNDKGK
jgi:hypothetical protein